MTTLIPPRCNRLGAAEPGIIGQEDGGSFISPAVRPSMTLQALGGRLAPGPGNEPGIGYVSNPASAGRAPCGGARAVSRSARATRGCGGFSGAAIGTTRGEREAGIVSAPHTGGVAPGPRANV